MTIARELINRITRTGRGKGRLAAAPSRDAIKVSTSEARNATTQATSGGGVASPLTEISNSATVWTWTSSDGLFSFEIPQETTYEDALTETLQVNHKEPTP